VVDRTKGVTLHSLASVLLGSQSRDGQQAVQLITADEAGVRNGASLMVHGTKVTKGGAAFANAEMAMAGGKLDSFRMLTHPGTSIVPGAFVAAETAGVSGRDFLTHRFVFRNCDVKRLSGLVPGHNLCLLVLWHGLDNRRDVLFANHLLVFHSSIPF
jgi:2-methylcitrate dehydratase PrpD